MQVLDKGYIVLIDRMGDDFTPARAARVSYGDDSKGEERDLKLTRYLREHDHMSPFEMVEVVFEVKAPIFVARQWVRYRTANINEFSMRYAEPSKLSENEDIEFYIPDQFRKQGNKNKQSSGEPFSDLTNKTMQYNLMGYYTDVQAEYEELIERGVSREQARMILPVGTYTKFIWKNDFRNVMHFIEQRDHEDAQWEIRQYAQAMRRLLELEFPKLMEVWRK